MNSDLVIPASPEVERSIIGSILVNNELWPSTAEVLTADHFSVDAHRRIFSAMAALAEDGTPIDKEMLLTVLTGRNDLAAVGGTAWVLDLTNGVPARKTLDGFIKVAKEKAVLRAIIHASNAAISGTQESGASSEAVLSGLESATLNLRAECSSEQKVVPVSSVCRPYWDNLESQRGGADNICIGLSTGIQPIDFLTTGIRPQQMWTVAGRTGEGKSVIAAQMISATCKAGKGVYLATPEMTKEQTLERLLIQNSGVPAWKFQKKYKLSEQDRETIKQTLKTIHGWNLHIDDSSSISAEEISARARLASKRDNVELAIIDYVQLVDGKGHDLKSQVTHVSKRLRALAKDVMPVVTLSQMPRPSDKKNLNHWPTKYDLKESGSLENDSAVILMVFRKVDDKNLPIGEDYLVVPKQRNGNVGFEAVRLNPDTLTFEPRVGQ